MRWSIAVHKYIDQHAKGFRVLQQRGDIAELHAGLQPVGHGGCASGCNQRNSAGQNVDMKIPGKTIKQGGLCGVCTKNTPGQNCQFDCLVDHATAHGATDRCSGWSWSNSGDKLCYPGAIAGDCPAKFPPCKSETFSSSPRRPARVPSLVAALPAADKDDAHVGVAHHAPTARERGMHGEYYHFVDRATFEAMIRHKGFSGIRRGVWQLLRHLAALAARAAVAGARHPAGNRLARRPTRRRKVFPQAVEHLFCRRRSKPLGERRCVAPDNRSHHRGASGRGALGNRLTPKKPII